MKNFNKLMYPNPVNDQGFKELCYDPDIDYFFFQCGTLRPYCGVMIKMDKIYKDNITLRIFLRKGVSNPDRYCDGESRINSIPKEFNNMYVRVPACQFAAPENYLYFEVPFDYNRFLVKLDYKIASALRCPLSVIVDFSINQSAEGIFVLPLSY